MSQGTCLARFWLAASIRQAMPPPIKTFLCIGPFSIEHVPHHFERVVDTFNANKDLFKKPTEPPEVKAIYKSIRKPKETTDDSMKGMLEWTRLFHSLNPSVPQRDRPKFWTNFWNASFAGFSPNYVQSCTWKLRHYCHFVGEKCARFDRLVCTLQHNEHNEQSQCRMCNQATESMTHCFFTCTHAIHVWPFYSSYLNKLVPHAENFSWVHWGLMMFTGRHKPTIKTRLAITIVSYIIHGIWTIRCKQHHTEGTFTPSDMRRKINFNIRRFLYAKFVSSKRKNDLQTFNQTFALNKILCKVTHGKFACVI